MSRAARRLCDWLVVGAERLMPPGQAEWARAMAAEQAQISDHRAALAFSAGCLRAAGSERLRSIAPDGRWLWPGVALGLLLVGSAAIPGSRSWPLLWAPIGGLLTVMVLAGGVQPSFGRAVAMAARAGLVGGSMFLVSATLMAVPAGAGASERMAGFAIAAVAMAFLTILGGAAAAPLVSRPPGAGASSAEEK